MEPPDNTLGSILGDLVGDEAERAAYRVDPEGFLAERGFPDMPDRVVGEAVCHVADTLPARVAEQLAPEVMALSPLTTVEYGADSGAGGMDALAALAAVPTQELVDLGIDTAHDIDVDGVDVVESDGSGSHVVDPDEPDRSEADPDVPTDTSASVIDSDPGFGTGVGTRTEQAAPGDLDGLDEVDGIDLPESDLTEIGPVVDDAGSVIDGLDAETDTAEESGMPTAPVDEPTGPDVEWDADLG